MPRKWTYSSMPLVLVAALLGVPAGAEVRSWDNGEPANSYWNSDNNWSPNDDLPSGDLIVTFCAPRANSAVRTDGPITLSGPAGVVDSSGADPNLAELPDVQFERCDRQGRRFRCLSQTLNRTGLAHTATGPVSSKGVTSLTWLV